jgi:hypothetical protein
VSAAIETVRRTSSSRREAHGEIAVLAVAVAAQSVIRVPVPRNRRKKIADQIVSIVNGLNNGSKRSNTDQSCEQ